METCATCRFFAPEATKCHRYPPIIPSSVTYSIFPTVKHDDWCGEHKPQGEPVTQPKE